MINSLDILVIEEDLTTRALIVGTLEDVGYTVGVMSDDADDERTMHVVIVDLSVPKSQGAKKLRSVRGRFPKARILAISGHFLVNAGASAFVARELGVDCVMAKPLDCRLLVANVRQFFDGS